MAKGNRVGIKGSKGRKNRKRKEDSEESDEEYKMTEDEECDETDDCYSFDSDESEEISADFDPSKRVVRSRNARRTSSGRNKDEMIQPRKRRRVLYTQDDRKSNQIKRPARKRMVSDTDVDDVNDNELANDRKCNQIKRPARNRMVLDTDIDEDDEDEDEDDSRFMSRSKKRNQLMKAKEKRIFSYKEGNEEEDDEKDAEFKLSESDFVDEEEEESPKMKKNGKVTDQGGWITVKKSNVKNPTRAKQRNQKTGRVRNKNQGKKRSKKKQKSIVESDSDFVSSASSDHEYTISEDEREQMKEARVYCANLRAKIRSSSCENHIKPPCKQRKYPERKSKEKIEETKDEPGKQVCGICLSEEGKRTVQGVLNCCRHYFCFSCIMEWSKVESRCPLCKQRFATITKSAKSDTRFDLRTMVVPVPKCDQVYQPSEEELRGYLDPYESVICSECHNGGDDALMLLCDVCDSSAHTFCVGLGQEVPEGNWYCDGCRPTVLFDSVNSRPPSPPTTTSDRRLSSNISELSSPVAVGFDLNEVYVPETPLTQPPREPIHAVSEFNPAFNGTGATTLRDRRRIHRHIHHRLINNNNNSNSNSNSNRTLGTFSSGIRLFGSQLNQTVAIPGWSAETRASFIGIEDHIVSSARGDRFPFVDGSLQGEGGGSGMGFNSRFGFTQLRPCNNRSSMAIGTDACREVTGPSRTSRGGLHMP